MKEIQLTKGKVALVDDADYDILMMRSWCYSDGYAWSKISGRKESMHRYLLGLPKGTDVDHINHNGCDNQRHNIRSATRSQNTTHTNYVRKNKTSRFRGVSWDKSRNRWVAHITVDRRTRFLGRFNKEGEAARAYDVAAVEAFGEFAHPSFQS